MTSPPANALDSSSIVIDRSSPVPLYFQIAQQYEAAIRSGAIPPGARLENEVKLAQDLGLSRPTVRSALGYLADRGLVVRRRGHGTVVGREKVQRPFQLTSLFDDLGAGGRNPSTKVLHNEVIQAPEALAESLKIEVGTLVTSLERLRMAGDEPIALMRNYIPASLTQFSTSMLERTGLYDLLRAAGVHPKYAEQSISARTATASEARQLDESRGAALLTMERTAFDDSRRPVEFAQHIYRASRYAYRTQLVAD